MSVPRHKQGQKIAGLPDVPVRHRHKINSVEEGSPDSNPRDYERLLDQYSQVESPAEGEVVRGKVLKVNPAGVVVDVGYKSEGIIPVEEFLSADGSIKVKPGDEIDVLLEFAEDGEGHVVLSREKAERIKAWDDIERAFNNQLVISGLVLGRIKGGLSVDIGAKAFLPGSLVDIRSVKNLDGYQGQTIQCKIIKINKRRGNIVLSRKLVLEEQRCRQRNSILTRLQDGLVVDGIVKNITDYGVFVDLGGIDGLLHVTDISWGRMSHPSMTFNLGSKIQVKVLKFDKEKERVSLGYKQLVPDPWESVSQRYPIETRLQATVTSLTDYGAFLEIEPGVEGLVHASEMSWNKRIKTPSRLVSVGDIVTAVVLDLNAAERKLSLGLKQTMPDPWKTLNERYKVGTVIIGQVRNLTDFGAFIEIEDGIDGLVHISDLSWTRKLKHPSELLKKGERVRAVILRLEVESHRLSLGIKQLQTDVWEEFFSKHHVGDLVQGRITHFASFGAFVEVQEGIEALCHSSEFEESTPGQNTSLLLDQSYNFRIIRLLPQERKIGLSLMRTQLEEREVAKSRAAWAGAQATSTQVARDAFSGSEESEQT
jgi:small subunit ribosomal protein S1